MHIYYDSVKISMCLRKQILSSYLMEQTKALPPSAIL